MARIKNAIQNLQSNETGDAYVWGGGGLLTIVLVILLIVLIF